jgi:hypothetical protein
VFLILVIVLQMAASLFVISDDIALLVIYFGNITLDSSNFTKFGFLIFNIGGTSLLKLSAWILCFKYLKTAFEMDYLFQMETE